MPRCRIVERCIACDTCREECPKGAIREGDAIYVVNIELCDSCGSCAEICPVDACVLDVE